MADTLYSPFQLGPHTLKNRVVMAPMTRSRSPGGTPGPTVATYYAQRAEAGLIITEGTSPSPNGLGYARIPGLFNDAQARGWRGVTDAVHQAGSKIFIQLMHTGRVGHPANMAADARIMAPSALALEGQMYTDTQGMQPHPVPQAMTEKDIESTLEEYAASAALAVNQAGFDGVELHGANGYLLEQFLNTASNQRTDRWGGSVENRMRFTLEAARRAANKVGPNRVGIRLSPYGANGGMKPDAETPQLYKRLAQELSGIGLAYLHLVDHSSMGAPPVDAAFKRELRDTFKGAFILSGGYDAKRAEADLLENKGDLVAFGRPFIANPRLVSKMKSGAELLKADHNLFFSPGEKGYTDWPTSA